MLHSHVNDVALQKYFSYRRIRGVMSSSRLCTTKTFSAINAIVYVSGDRLDMIVMPDTGD